MDNVLVIKDINKINITIASVNINILIKFAQFRIILIKFAPLVS